MIAAVNGIACGGGFELAISADMIIAADHASFALPEIRAGTLADAATIKLPKRIPYHVAMDLLLTGRWMDAEEARHFGLINEVVPADQLMDRVWEVARLLASGPPLVFAAIKETIRETETATTAEAFAMLHESRLPTVRTLYDSEDQMGRGASVCGKTRSGVEGTLTRLNSCLLTSMTLSSHGWRRVS